MRGQCSAPTCGLEGSVIPVSEILILGFLLAAAGSHRRVFVCAFGTGSHSVALAGIQDFSFPVTLIEVA